MAASGSRRRLLGAVVAGSLVPVSGPAKPEPAKCLAVGCYYLQPGINCWELRDDYNETQCQSLGQFCGPGGSCCLWGIGDCSAT